MAVLRPCYDQENAGLMMFTGFTEETIAFFAALKFNNNRDFFEAQKPVFERTVREPLIALADALADTVTEIDPQLDVRPGRVVSRIHRDLRFSRNRTPYRDYMWIGYRHVGESREETCGFYFDLSAEAANWGCGYYHMQPETMRNLRAKLVEEPARVRKILCAPVFASRFELMGDAYVRQHQPPEGMDPVLGLVYRKKSVYAEHHVQRMADLFSPTLAKTIAEDFRVLAPFYKFLRACMVKRIEGVET